MTTQPVRLTFGSLEAVLAKMHSIAASKRTAFQSRLKNFHRLGFPIGFETSKGKAGIYNPGFMVEMALALEMTQLGLSPERLVHVLALNRFPTFMAVRFAASNLAAQPRGFDSEKVQEDDPISTFIFFDPAAMRNLMLDDPAMTPDIDQTDDTFFYGGQASVRENFVKWTSGEVNRLSLINVTAMIDMLGKEICPHDDEDAAIEWLKGFYAELEIWAGAQVEETYEHEASYFAGRLLENSYTPPASEEAEAFVARLIEETGLRPETIHAAFLDWATDHHAELIAKAEAIGGGDDGDR